MRKLSFWVYSAIMYSAFTFAFSYAIAMSFFTPGGGLLYFIFLFVEFYLALLLSWLMLKHIIDFKARNVIVATSAIGWFPASLLMGVMINIFSYLIRPYDYFPRYYDFYMFFSIATTYSLFHSIVYCVGALIGALVPVSYGERLKKKILFAVSRGGDTVDLLKLAVNLEDDLPNVKDGVLRLIKEGHIVGYLDNASNKLHVSLTPSLPSASVPSAIQHSEGLVREYNMFKSLLKDLEELQKQNRISSSSYDALREEYEHKLKLLESAMREFPA